MTAEASDAVLYACEEEDYGGYTHLLLVSSLPSLLFDLTSSARRSASLSRPILGLTICTFALHHIHPASHMLVSVPSAIALAVFLTTVVAKPFLTIESANVTHCDKVKFKYGGGTPPYTFTAMVRNRFLGDRLIPGCAHSCANVNV